MSELRNPFEPEPAKPRNTDTAGFIGHYLGPEAQAAFGKNRKKPKPPEQPPELSAEDRAVLQKAQAELERSKERFPIWRTLRIGMHKKPKEFDAAFKAKDIKVGGSWTMEALETMTCVSAPFDIELVNVSAEDIDVPEGSTFEEICNKAEHLGLSVCPIEAGPELRLQYLNQPVSDLLFVATPPFEISSATLNPFQGIFFLTRDDHEAWINVYDVKNVQRLDGQWVFMRRRP